MKSKHDVGCGARRSESCDCEKGRQRRIRKTAEEFLKRGGNLIEEVPRGTFKTEGDWLSDFVKKGRER